MTARNAAVLAAFPFALAVAAGLPAQPLKVASVETLLLTWARTSSGMPRFGVFGADRLEDGAAREIVLRGFDVVPELLVLAEDQRLSRHLEQFSGTRPGGRPARTLRLGELACMLLGEISGLNDRAFNQVAPHPGDLRVWWKRAQTQGESKSLESAAFIRKGSSILVVQETPVRILAKKHPQVLPALVYAFTQRAGNSVSPQVLIDAVIVSALPPDEQSRILLRAVKESGYPTHRRAFLAGICARNSTLFMIH